MTTRTSKSPPSSPGTPARRGPSHSAFEDDGYLPPSASAAVPVGRAVRRPTVEMATLGNRPTGNPTIRRRAHRFHPGRVGRRRQPGGNVQDGRSAARFGDRPRPTLRPLHERLSSIPAVGVLARQSEFASGGR